MGLNGLKLVVLPCVLGCPPAGKGTPFLPSCCAACSYTPRAQQAEWSPTPIYGTIKPEVTERVKELNGCRFQKLSLLYWHARLILQRIAQISKVYSITIWLTLGGGGEWKVAMELIGCVILLFGWLKRLAESVEEAWNSCWNYFLWAERPQVDVRWTLARPEEQGPQWSIRSRAPLFSALYSSPQRLLSRSEGSLSPFHPLSMKRDR